MYFSEKPDINTAAIAEKIEKSRNKAASAALKAERRNEFLKVVKRLSEERSAEISRLIKRAAGEEDAALKKKNAYKINELYALISQLKQKLAVSGFNKKIAAQLSMVQTELFWLLAAI